MTTMRIFLLCIAISMLVSCKQQSLVHLSTVPDGENDEKLIRMDPPVYPELYRYLDMEGYVVVEFDLTEDGRVENAKVIEDKPEGIFRAAALKAIRSSVYKPRFENGVPVRVEGKRTNVRFTLAGKSVKEDDLDKISCKTLYSDKTLNERDCDILE